MTKIRKIQMMLITVFSFLMVFGILFISNPGVAYAGTIGATYNFGYPMNLPNADHVTCGHATVAKPTTVKTVSLSMNSKNDAHQNYAQYRILTNYMYEHNIINMPVVQYFNSYYATSTAGQYTKTLEKTVSNTKTYEEELKSSISTKVGYQAGIKIEGVGVSADAEVKTAVEKSVGFSNTIFVSERTTDTMVIPASPVQKYYMWEERADFEVMCIQVLEIQYSKINEQSHGALWWKWTSWDWKETGMILREEYFVYKYLGTGKFNGLMEYTISNGNFIYNGPKPNASVIYI